MQSKGDNSIDTCRRKTWTENNTFNVRNVKMQVRRIISQIRQYGMYFSVAGVVGRTMALRVTSPCQDINVDGTSGNGDADKRFTWIGRVSPCFGINGNQVHIIQEPCDFHKTLKEGISNAKHRIVLSTLYLGTGELEQQLVDAIDVACEKAKSEGNQDFEVVILIDHVRGSRGGNKSSRTMLAPLINKFPDVVKVHLFHTPNLRGFLKSLLPEKANETIGLNHMKIYLFDDSFIISGANLNDTYFTNRQDRYLLYNNCLDLANFLTSLVKGVGQSSFLLQGDNTTTLSHDCSSHPYEGNDGGRAFKQEFQQRIESICAQYHQNFNNSEMTNGITETSSQRIQPSTSVDTWVYPTIQMGQFNINNDQLVMDNLFTGTQPGDSVYLASGYFNLTQQYMDTILHKSKAQFKFLMCSIENNGFYQASWPLGGIPYAYIKIARNFYEKIKATEQTERLELYEYFRQDWTFHVKGLWYYPCGSDLPSMTIVGSSNFGYRSLQRDLECQLYMVTENKDLQQRLKQEQERFFGYQVKLTDEEFTEEKRRVPRYISWLLRGIQNLF